MRQLRKLFLQLAHSYIHTLIIPYATIKKKNPARWKMLRGRHSESRQFAGTNVNKIMTIEASGIAPAIMTGYLMDLPVVFAKKKSPKTIQNALSTTVHSFTKDRDYEVVISSDFLTPEDNILFVDDFLAYGNAALGVLDLIKQSGANLVGMGFIIEKAFQNGRKTLEERGVRVESLAIIEDLSNCQIKIR